MLLLSYHMSVDGFLVIFIVICLILSLLHDILFVFIFEIYATFK